jgi:hypothetical protein
MQLINTLPFRLERPTRRPTRQVREQRPDQRRDRSGGPQQDRALYTCGCGYAFTAAVSTTVGCPHCGTSQAW